MMHAPPCPPLLVGSHYRITICRYPRCLYSPRHSLELGQLIVFVLAASSLCAHDSRFSVFEGNVFVPFVLPINPAQFRITPGIGMPGHRLY